MGRTLEETYYVIQHQHDGRLESGYGASATPKLYKKKGQALSLARGDKVLAVKLQVIEEVPKSDPT
jgi:hypothetical protein